jgi:serine/threonine protein kinase
MPLAQGARLGRFEIATLLGAGGMGDVYRATDTMLGREVALKVVADEFAQHPDRLARFAREARLLASLSHPNIAVVHGLERVDDVYYLEMELVRGETLAERIARGPLSVEDSLRIFRQVGEALEAAHGQSIVHRDLKPANVMVTLQGVVKVLDFGLAKVISGEDSGPPVDGPTEALTRTDAGVVMGTAAYMSPEQVRGDRVDRRADIWAFGCMLYEALTGRRAFPGRTNSDTLAAVLKEEPDWAGLAAVAPVRLQRLVRRCLQKNPHVRLHDIADARIEIDEALREPAPSTIEIAAQFPTPRRRAAAIGRWAAALMVAFNMGAGLMWVWSRSGASGQPITRATIALSSGMTLPKGHSSPVAFSPDGRSLAYAAATSGGGQPRLYLRRLDESESRPIPATEGARTPFFSPDGQWVAFYSGRSLKKVSLAGGVPLTIGETPPPWSASWGGERIVFATTLAPGGLWMVPAEGGEATQLTTPGTSEAQHGYPQLLPGGRQGLFGVLRDHAWRPAVLSLDSGEWHLLGSARAIDGGAQYLPTGHLVYAQSGGLVAEPFDLNRGVLGGTPMPLLERPGRARFRGAPFAVAPDAGALVYLPAEPDLSGRSLLRVDRDGRALPLVEDRLAYEQPAVSPDGRRVAVTIASEAGSDVWVFDLARGTRVPFTSGGTSAFPVWAPDGSRLAFQSTVAGPWNLYSKPADGSAEGETLFGAINARTEAPVVSDLAGLLPGTLPSLTGANPQFPASWRRDRSAFAFHERKADGERDIWVVGTDGTPVPFLLTPFDERSPRFSPDGRWLAYVSDESGRDEVYVQPYPGPGRRWLISTDGGADPVWSHDGRELFYVQEPQLMAVSIAASDEFSASRPRRLFDARFTVGDDRPNYDVSPDGKWFILPWSERRAPPVELHLVLNWLGALTARASAAGQSGR